MILLTIFNNKKIRLLTLLIVLLYSLYEYSWGLWLPDSFYWVGISRFWKEEPMTLLSLWSMDEWYKMMGRTLVANRFMAWVLNTATVLLAYIVLLEEEQRLKYWYFLCGGIVILGPGIAKICTPECQSSLIVLILIACTLKYNCSSHKIVWLFFISVLTALVVAFRFPNIVCIPFIMSYLFLISFEIRKGIAVSVVYLILSIILFWILMAVVLETTNVFGEIIKSFIQASGASNGRHNLTSLLMRYGKSALLSLPAIVIGSIVFFIAKKIRGRNRVASLFFLTIVSSIFLYEIYGRIGLYYHSWTVCLVDIAAFSLLYCSYCEWKQNKKVKAYGLSFVVLMVFVPSAGSDTGFYKSIILACALAPFVVSSLERCHVEKSYIAMTFFIFIFTSVLIFNKNASNHHYTTEIKSMRYILWEKEQMRNIEQLNNSVKPYFMRNNTVFYGMESHYLYCTTNTNMPYSSYWMHYNDTIEINRMVDIMKDTGKSILIDLTKSDSVFYTKKGLRIIAKEQRFNVYTTVLK